MFTTLGSPLQSVSGFAAFGSLSTFTPASGGAPVQVGGGGTFVGMGQGAAGSFAPSYELMQESGFSGGMGCSCGGGLSGMGGGFGGFGGFDAMSGLTSMMGMAGMMMGMMQSLGSLIPGLGGQMAQLPKMPGFGKRAGKARGANKSGARKSGGAKSANPGGKIGGGDTRKYDNIILAAAKKYGVDPNLVKSVIKAESNFNPSAGSSAGARGLMQLMPATAAGLGCNNTSDPRQNIFAGTKYLSQMLKAQKGNVKLALASYNAGPGNVAKYGGVPPFAETQAYVKKILADLASRKSA